MGNSSRGLAHTIRQEVGENGRSSQKQYGVSPCCFQSSVHTSPASPFGGHLCAGVTACYGISLIEVQATNLQSSFGVFGRANRSHLPFLSILNRFVIPSPPN